MIIPPETGVPRRDLTNKTVVINGASAGIGEVTARELARRGARVVVIGRNPERTRAVAESVRGPHHLVDHASLASVRRLAAELLDSYPQIDVMMHNAGGITLVPTVTKDGLDQTVQTNYVAPFLLQQLLSQRLADSAAQVVVTSSSANKLAGTLDPDTWLFSRNPGYACYALTKLADLLWARALARRTPTVGAGVCSFHPGTVRTNIAAGNAVANWLFTGPLAWPFTRSAQEGAWPMITLACAEPTAVNGQYWHRMKPQHGLSEQALDDDLGERLWRRTEEFLG